jgi:hypothetical protein
MNESMFLRNASFSLDIDDVLCTDDAMPLLAYLIVSFLPWKGYPVKHGLIIAIFVTVISYCTYSDRMYGNDHMRQLVKCPV